MKWNELKQDKLKKQEEAIFGLCDREVSEESDQDKEMKRKWINKMRKELKKQRSFKHLTNNVDKGRKGGFKRAHAANDEGVTQQEH